MASTDPHWGGAFQITPSDIVNLPHTIGLLYVGKSGDLHTVFHNGTEVTLSKLPQGMYNLKLRKIFSTGTTASNLVGIYEVI